MDRPGQVPGRVLTHWPGPGGTAVGGSAPSSREVQHPGRAVATGHWGPGQCVNQAATIVDWADRPLVTDRHARVASPPGDTSTADT